ncbi:hypothetical protein [Kocuria palustris]|uniref:hypothetical protein n=1 Tax=Kocuria palustris TaxID=71999 RepID=UPI0028D08421|nr:hypothetical protein [Kocuria palustris]
MTGAIVAAPAATAQTVRTGDTSGPGKVAYLHGNQQSQIMCRGGALVGAVDSVVVDPITASGNLPAGSCNLADMRAANPGVKFYAYLDIGGISDASSWTRDPFHSTCVSLNRDGANYTVRPNNSRVAVDSNGRAVYPGFSHLRIASLSSSYNASCADRAADIVTTDSVRGTTGAAPTQFDGVFLDDMAMSPAQGQNMRDIGTWGPWGSDDGYGQAMLRTVAAIDDEVARRDGGAKIAGNLGVYADYPNQQALAKQLGSSRDLDWIFRESTIGGANGSSMGAWHVTQQNGALMGQVAALGTPVVMHNFAVNATTTPAASGGVGGSCLLDSTPNAGALQAAVDTRRARDMSMVLATTLMSRTGPGQLQTAVAEAQTTCRETRDSGKQFRESIFWYSLDEDRSETADLRYAVNWKGLYAVGDTQFAYDRHVHSRKLNDGRWVRINFLNYGVTVNGHYIPPRTGVLTR